MKYSVGDVIVARKKHPCGGDRWTVVRTGADYKIKCERCGRYLIVDGDSLDKMKKTIVKNGD